MIAPLGRKNGEPGRNRIEHEQAHLAAELAMVARARQLEQLEMLFQRLLARERGAVDPRRASRCARRRASTRRPRWSA